MNRLACIVILFFCINLLNACGQTGDLYLPTDEPEEKQAKDKE